MSRLLLESTILYTRLIGTYETTPWQKKETDVFLPETTKPGPRLESTFGNGTVSLGWVR